MDRLYILAPALIPASYMVVMLVIYTVRQFFGRPPEVADGGNKISEVFGPFLTQYFLWLLAPIERLFVVRRVSPNVLTAASLVACAAAGVAIATGHLATAAWTYILAGALDILDGRLARATRQSSRAGAFLDSISDRWGELFVFGGFVWLLRDSYWLGAVLLAMAGSMMVSYTRARGEGLGVALDGGFMQRPERIALVATGTLITAWFDAGRDTAEYVPHVIGVALALTGLGSSVTAVGRWIQGYRLLAAGPTRTPRASRRPRAVRLSKERPAQS